MIAGIGERAATWWSAWKFVVILAAALAASLWVNVWQWKRAIAAPLRAEVAARDEALLKSEQLLADTQSRAAELADAASVAAAQLGSAGAAYANAKKQRPITDPKCAPGQARVDALNKALGQPDAETGD